MPRLLPLLFLLLSACPEATRVEVRLHGPPTFDPAEALDEIEVRVEEAETGDTIGGSGTGRVDSRDPTLEGVRLQTGVAYRVFVRGTAEACADPGLAIGESLPFVHDEGGDRVDVYVACHGEAMLGPDLPVPRALHTATWLSSDSRALVTGGATTVGFGEGGVEGGEPEAGVLEMDVPTGVWSEAAPMLSPRRGHAAVEVPEGLAIFGGRGNGGMDFDDSVELLAGTGRRSLSALGARFLAPAGAPLGHQVLLAGEADPGVETPRGLAEYDVGRGTTRFVPGDPGSLRGAAVVALDGADRALVVGGASANADVAGAVRLYCEDACGECDTPPCWVDVPAEAALPTPDWSNMAAAWVPCAAGGGAVVIAGGDVGAEGDRTTTDAIHCWRQESDLVGTVVGSSRTLTSPRAGAAVGVLERIGTGFWVVVAGGLDTTESPVPARSPGADLLEINGCTCDLGGVRRIELPSGTDRATVTVASAVARLGDGSLVLVGGLAEWDPGESVLDASSRVVRFR